jgi:hypothetical protein
MERDQTVPFERALTMQELIGLLRSGSTSDASFCVYGEGDSTEASLDSTCYICAYPDITDDYEEKVPEFVAIAGLELWFRDELVQDVVANALHQDSWVVDQTILSAIHHYDESDSFLTISPRDSAYTKSIKG